MILNYVKKPYRVIYELCMYNVPYKVMACFEVVLYEAFHSSAFSMIMFIDEYLTLFDANKNNAYLNSYVFFKFRNNFAYLINLNKRKAVFN